MTTWTDDENGGTVWSEDEAAGTALGASTGSSLVGFIQSGTGAVAGTVSDELTDLWVRPEHYSAVTLATSTALNGSKFRIVRTANATGAFNLNVGTGPLKALTAGQWCDVEYNGSAWFLSAFGSL